MAYALVANTISTGGADGSTTPAIDTTGATILICVVSNYEVSAAPTLSDSKTNTWNGLTVRSNGAVANDEVRIFYATNPTVGTLHTFTVTGTGSYSLVAVAAFSGAATTTPFDVENGAVAGANTSLATGSITPSENDELIIAGISFENPDTLSIDQAMTITNQVPWSSGVTFGCALAYKIQTTAAAINATWSWTTSDNIAVAIGSFKAAPGGGGGATWLGYYSSRGGWF